MTEAYRLNILRTSSEIGTLLKRDFDFRPLSATSASQLFKLNGTNSYELVATDASGGEFALCQKSELPERSLLYVSSEGQAGVIARSLKEGLSMMMAVPHWQDCLKFSGNGLLEEMRRALSFCEADALEDRPDLDSSRQILYSRLELPVLSDPVQFLYTAATELTPYFPVYAIDGSPLQGLFNKFTVVSNPVWRRKLNGPA